MPPCWQSESFKQRQGKLPGFETESITSNQVLATGWGFLQSGRNPSRHLMQVWLNVIDYEECLKRLQKGNKNHEKFLTAKNVCTWSAGKDTCGGNNIQHLTN